MGKRLQRNVPFEQRFWAQVLADSRNSRAVGYRARAR